MKKQSNKKIKSLIPKSDVNHFDNTGNLYS